ncbi:MAG: hypothetical protein K0V04_02135 [Deltaproteobacteria bacterium]|nr:hypothetical protein [Deltaproteobacteria bacterium]
MSLRRIARAVLFVFVVLSWSLGPVSAAAAEGTGASLGLRMRIAPEPPLDAEAKRGYAGVTAIKDEPGREATWVDPRPDPEPEPEPESDPPDEAGEVTGAVPPPSSIRDVPEHVTVAVGLGPRAPGTRDEKALLDALEASVAGSTSPTTELRRLRPGAGAPRRICRERRDDLVVMIGYIADRDDPVLLAHDCRLDEPLGVRAAAAASQPQLVATLWREHLDLLQAGARERRRLSVGPKARGGIIAGVAIVVVGVAVGVLVANALRDESVVITVRP